MAMREWTAADLDAAADDLEFVSKRLRETAAEMREKNFPQLVLQADATFGVYRTAYLKLAGAVGAELRDQYRCSQTKELPRWQRNQKTVEARKQAEEWRKKAEAGDPVALAVEKAKSEAKADRIAKGIEPVKKATKKAAKKRGS